MFDAIVVGAGPGGSTAACFMARAGLDVLLVDGAGFPRDKVCGDAISRRAVSILAEIGVSALDDVDGCLPSYGLRIAGSDGTALSLTFDDAYASGRPPGYVCTRRSFDALLVRQAKAAGATFWPHARVGELVREDERVVGVRLTRLQGEAGDAASGRFPRDETIRAPLVIGADGAYSVVARELRLPQLDDRHLCAGIRAYFNGVETADPHHSLEVHFLDHAPPAYLWIFPLPGGRANVGVGMLSSTIKKQGIQLKDVLLESLQLPQLRDRFGAAEMMGVTKAWGLPLGSRPREMAGDGWMLVGDAASLADPFSGEGIGNAMLSGRLAAEVAARAAERSRFGAEALKPYPKNVMRALGPELRRSERLQRLGKWGWLRDSVIRKGSRSQDLARAMAEAVADERRRRRLLSPLFYLRVLAA